MGVIPARKNTGLLKPSLPYLFLVSLYLSYLFLGSLIYGALESSTEQGNVQAIKNKESRLKAEIEELFLNRSSVNGDMAELDRLHGLLEDLVDTVSHPDWIPGRLDLLETPGDVWGIPNAMLFCMTTITTIGYGDLVPTTDMGRLFTIFYSCLGVPLSFLFFAVNGGLLARLASRIAIFVRRRIWGTKKKKPTPSASRSVSNEDYRSIRRNVEAAVDDEVFNTDAGGDQNVNAENIKIRALPSNSEQNKRKPPPLQRQQSIFAKADIADEDIPFLVVILFIISYVCVGAVSFSIAEGWSYFEAFYFTFITLTTIGFGDYTPTHHFENGTHFPTMLYTLVGLCYISMCVSLLQTRFVTFVTKAGEKITGLVNTCKTSPDDN